MVKEKDDEAANGREGGLPISFRLNLQAKLSIPRTLSPLHLQDTASTTTQTHVQSETRRYAFRFERARVQK